MCKAEACDPGCSKPGGKASYVDLLVLSLRSCSVTKHSHVLPDNKPSDEWKYTSSQHSNGLTHQGMHAQLLQLHTCDFECTASDLSASMSASLRAASSASGSISSPSLASSQLRFRRLGAARLMLSSSPMSVPVCMHGKAVLFGGTMPVLAVLCRAQRHLVEPIFTGYDQHQMRSG